MTTPIPRRKSTKKKKTKLSKNSRLNLAINSKKIIKNLARNLLKIDNNLSVNLIRNLIALHKNRRPN